MVPVVQNGVPGHNPIPASKSSTGNKDWHYSFITISKILILFVFIGSTSFTWHLRIPTAKTTSLKSFLSMV